MKARKIITSEKGKTDTFTSVINMGCKPRDHSYKTKANESDEGTGTLALAFNGDFFDTETGGKDAVEDSYIELVISVGI